MSPSKILVMAAIGIWLVTAVIAAIAWSVPLQGFPFLLSVPFTVPAVVASGLHWALSLGWTIALSCCAATAWLLAAVEVWRRPRTRFAWCLFAVWDAFVVVGYYSVYQSLSDL